MWIILPFSSSCLMRMLLFNSETKYTSQLLFCSVVLQWIMTFFSSLQKNFGWATNLMFPCKLHFTKLKQGGIKKPYIIWILCIFLVTWVDELTFFHAAICIDILLSNLLSTFPTIMPYSNYSKGCHAWKGHARILHDAFPFTKGFPHPPFYLLCCLLFWQRLPLLSCYLLCHHFLIFGFLSLHSWSFHFDSKACSRITYTIPYDFAYEPRWILPVGHRRT